MARRRDNLLTAEDFRRAARRRLPRLFFDYIDGAAGDEITARRNADAFAEIALHPRALRDVSDRTLAARFLGSSFDLPLMLGPIGSLGMFRAGAETDAVRTAHRFGIPLCLSAFAMTAPEDMPEPPRPGDAWQLYVLKDRGRTGAIMDRIAEAGFDTLFVTVDTAVSGLRERDIRNGLRRITRPNAAMLADMALHPRWLLDFARIWPPQMGVARDWSGAGRSYLEQAAFLAGQIDPSFDGRGLDWLRARWKGRLVVKGILHPDDARLCLDAGADALVVSNHGGRQFDGAPATISALPAIAEAVAGRIGVLLDGGIRRGGDVVKALTLGADACLLGRAYAFALAAAGEAGLVALLGHFRAEIDTSTALLGKVSVADLRSGDAVPDLPRVFRSSRD
ncbi:alpha-hydroxy acid oxidase [Defluviimonas sp. SAOS-178_SWC]|uniref:alpha-hydroxy acid oxidase n=1 Tax=Defluviimonas sp. SAOS-178_SWC TaxID=3121287 RepID=UPI00322195A8